MSQQLINIGNTANDGTGVRLRDAFRIVNENFTEVYTSLNGNVSAFNATFDGNVTANNIMSQTSTMTRSLHQGVIVAALPPASAANAGATQYVTDASATTIGSVVAGGGANKVMVWSNGSDWKIFAN